ncbi:MAG: hypothetical protein N4A47_02100 [Clostridia bacterium]|nr:hypothetical protein [Clostridia bacterium]
MGNLIKAFKETNKLILNKWIIVILVMLPILICGISSLKKEESTVSQEKQIVIGGVETGITYKSKVEDNYAIPIGQIAKAYLIIVNIYLYFGIIKYIRGIERFDSAKIKRIIGYFLMIFIGGILLTKGTRQLISDFYSIFKVNGISQEAMRVNSQIYSDIVYRTYLGFAGIVISIHYLFLIFSPYEILARSKGIIGSMEGTFGLVKKNKLSMFMYFIPAIAINYINLSLELREGYKIILNSMGTLYNTIFVAFLYFEFIKNENKIESV